MYKANVGIPAAVRIKTQGQFDRLRPQLARAYNIKTHGGGVVMIGILKTERGE